ncbi:MAG TPA: hypothetical protein VGH32_00680 [Pirellulales bacterium]
MAGCGSLGADEIPAGEIRQQRIIVGELLRQSDDRCARQQLAQLTRVAIDIGIALGPAGQCNRGRDHRDEDRRARRAKE